MTTDTAPDLAITGEHLPAAAPATDIAEWRPIAAGLADLTARAALANFDFSTAAGVDAARKVRREIVSLRTRVEEIRAREKGPLLERGRQIDAFAKWLTAGLEAIESPVDREIKADELRKAAAKAERERAERERLAAIAKRIDWIRAQPAEAARCKTSSDVLAIADRLAAVPMTDDLYAEQLALAIDTQAASLAWLREHAKALAEREAEAARLAQERAAFEAQQAEQRRVQEAEDARRREEQARQDAERAARIAREDAERQAKQRAEDEARAVAARQQEERIAAARAEVEARERAEREERERQEAEARAQRAREEQAERDRRRRERDQLEEQADPWAALASIRHEIQTRPDNLLDVVEHILRIVDQTLAAREALDRLDQQEPRR